MHVTLIDASQVASAASHTCIVDVRADFTEPGSGKAAFLRSRIPGAIFLDVETDLSGARTSGNGRHPLPDREAFHRLMVQAGVGRDTQVVAYDAQGGAIAARLWWMMRWLGHARVAVLDGGWQAWQAAGLPIDEQPLNAIPALPGPAADPLPLTPPLHEPVEVAQVLANIDTPRFTLVDARAVARYRGEIEPLDPVAGHIPGALNRPHLENLADDGRFKPIRRLREEFAAVLGDRPPEAIVHQCGSGITACHNLLAMEHAGLKGSRLYAGSWSEWCSDPVRPVA